MTSPPAPTYDQLVTSHTYDSDSATWRLVLTTFEIPPPPEDADPDAPLPDPIPVDEFDYIWDGTDERWNGLTPAQILELQRADVAAAMKRHADEAAATEAAASASLTEHIDAPQPLPSHDDPQVLAAIDAFEPPPPPPTQTAPEPIRTTWAQGPDGTPEQQT